MAALLRQGARRIGGSVLQRTQAAVSSPAVAEERRRLVPRRMLSTEKPTPQAIQQKKDELYELLSQVENWQNRRLLQDLAVHVYPREPTIQWRRLRASKWATNVVRAVANVTFAATVAVADHCRIKIRDFVAED
ncbi:unnamed protein product [Alopecurus aequalis]